MDGSAGSVTSCTASMRIHRCTGGGLVFANSPSEPVATAVAKPPSAVIAATQIAALRETFAVVRSGGKVCVLMRART